ncbi:MAG: heavy-metal-associated domain-containing protein [Nitrospirae bacterium]|nr:heavy-metal-associated domain-containing protein [Nitrospirota bacterium]
MTEVEIKVEGMSCMHCVGRVRKAVEALNGIKALDVQVGLVKASFDENILKKEEIEKAISGAGYKVASS